MHPTCLPVGRHARLIHLSTDAFKSELLSVSFLLPLTTEQVQKNIMLLALSKRGTVAYPTRALLVRHMDELYSTALTTVQGHLGDCEMLGHSADFLGSRFVGGHGLLPDVVATVSDLMQHPFMTAEGLYRADYVESEKRDLTDAIRAEINNPRAYALARCRELLCAGEPYAISIIGKEADVAAIDPAGLTARMQEWQRELAPVFCYVGAQSAEEVAKRLADAFDTFGGAGTPYTAVIKPGEGTVRKEETMPLSQGKLSLGFRLNLADVEEWAPVMTVLNEIYGASSASKLFMNVREKRSLCYNCSSGVVLRKGLLFANSGMKPENRAVTEEAMLDEMKHIAAGEISDFEWDAAMRSLAHVFRQFYDAPGAVAKFYATRALRGVDETIEACRDRVLAVTRSQVVEAARHLHLRAVFFLNGNGEEPEDDEI